MKVSTILVAIGALAVSVVTQNLNAFPTCSQTCLLTGIQSTSCSLTDFKCACESSAFISSSTSCIKSSCDTADQAQASNAAVALCSSEGVSVSIPPVTTAGTAPTTTPAAGGGATTTPSAPAQTTAASGSTGCKAKYRKRYAPSRYD